jgi:hypothetical protein
VSEKSYKRALGENARKRHSHKTDKGKVVDFVVQLEVKVGGLWRPVIRYDCTHDFAHVDRYNISGETLKEDLHLSYDECLTLADEDINFNWESYAEKFLRGEFP